MRIDSEETRRAGVDMHVCEVQLTLRAFAELMVIDQFEKKDYRNNFLCMIMTWKLDKHLIEWDWIGRG